MNIWLILSVFVLGISVEQLTFSIFDLQQTGFGANEHTKEITLRMEDDGIGFGNETKKKCWHQGLD